MHNIFTREHNTICDMLKRYYPEWSDQQLYDKARYDLKISYLAAICIYVTLMTGKVHNILPV